MGTKYIYCILIALCFLVYANSLNNAFVSDDIGAILNYPFISETGRFLMDPSALSESINYLMGKTDPFIYHLTNIILHALNTILIYLFLRLWFKPVASLLGAALFAVHPIHTEAVTWISGRPYVILSIFILLAYFLYEKACGTVIIRGEERENEAGEIAVGGVGSFNLYYWISLAVFTYFLWQHLSFYFLFPLFLVLADIVFKRWRSNWKLWLPFFGILALRLILAKGEVITRAVLVAKGMGTDIAWTNPLYNMTYSVLSYAGLLLWPARLTLYHEPPVISVLALRLGIAALCLLAISLPLIFRKARGIFFGIAIFILFLAPTYSPVMVSWLVAERYAYFPSVLLSICLAFSYDRGISRIKNINTRNMLIGLALFIIAAYAVRTVARNEDWKTEERFWRQTVIASPASPRSHNNMGDVYSREGNVAGAITEFKKAIEIKPDYADAYHNLATTYYRQGDLTEAVKLYERAVYFNPELFESRYNLGLIYLNTNKLNAAIAEFQKALELRPNDLGARQALAIALEKKG